ncbi:MAG: hypothetical protein FJ271_05045 [Planctomycetes bacterium]|nr:hypothetical protein [Planctomycetota bacterium]
MIWFSCKGCGKTHGRPEASAGSLLFCECGHGNQVPWESTVPPPADTAAPAGVPVLEPLKFEQSRLEPRTDSPLPHPSDGDERRERRSRRPGRKFRFDPNFCLNHNQLPSRKTCRDCGEAFCNDCVIELEGDTLCGPCKNYRVRSWQQPPRVSGFALFSVLGGLIAGLLGILAVVNGAGLTICIIALLAQSIVLALGGIGLHAVERNPTLGGRWLAITGVLLAGTSIFLTTLFAFFTPGLLS